MVCNPDFCFPPNIPSICGSGVHCLWDAPSPTGNLPTVPCNALPGHQASEAAAHHLLRHRSKIRDGSCLSSKDLAILTTGVLDFTFLEVQTEESGTRPILHQCLPGTTANCLPALMGDGKVLSSSTLKSQSQEWQGHVQPLG